jgi:hypothetical protein
MCWKSITKLAVLPQVQLHLNLSSETNKQTATTGNDLLCRIINFLTDAVHINVAQLLAEKTAEGQSSSREIDQAAFTRITKIARFYLLHLCSLVKVFPAWVGGYLCSFNTLQ